MDLRKHRKLAVIDRRVGYTGSQNLASAGFVPGFPNREVVARVEGPVVSQLGALFASDWYIETGVVLAMPEHPPEAAGPTPAQLLPLGPAYPFANPRTPLSSPPPHAPTPPLLAPACFAPA